MDKMKKKLLVFGYGVAVIATFFAWRIWAKWGHNPKSIVFLCVAALFILLTLFKQNWLKKIYDQWMKVAHLIGAIVTTIVLIVLYFFIFGVVGIILRLMRKDLLDMSLNPGAKTYWKEHEKNYNKDRYTKQF
jgi:hypothetical protein